LPFDAPPLIAHGGDLKNTFCLTSGRDAWMSQHLGDMGTLDSLRAFVRSARQFSDLYRVEPELLAADSHPGYHSAQWAEQHAGGRPVERVQHHHAHVAAVMAEHGLDAGARVIGFAFDGTGYGTDGAIWGGEVLVAGYDGFHRAAHLRYVPLPGGDATIRKPYRSALAHLWAAGIPWTPDLACVRAAGPGEMAVLERQLERGVLCVPTSSMGRLFDAVSSLVGLRHIVSYEGQAAIEMEVAAAAAAEAGGEPEYEFEVAGREIDPARVLSAIVDDLRGARSTGAVAAGFHRAVARVIGRLADELRDDTGVDCVALSGGVFQNVLLTRMARAELAGRGLRVLSHRLVPPNDGGLALGQAAVAAAGQPGPRA
jgi:hydrogenase maturation protein HypF